MAQLEDGHPEAREVARLVRAEIEASPCACLSPATIGGFDERPIGSDHDDADLAIHTCQRCRRAWIHYFYEDHIHDTSGRWYRGIVDAERAAALDADGATALLEAMPWKLRGGSYFFGRRQLTMSSLASR